MRLAFLLLVPSFLISVTAQAAVSCEKQPSSDAATLSQQAPAIAAANQLKYDLLKIPCKDTDVSCPAIGADLAALTTAAKSVSTAFNACADSKTAKLTAEDKDWYQKRTEVWKIVATEQTAHADTFANGKYVAPAGLLDALIAPKNITYKTPTQTLADTPANGCSVSAPTDVPSSCSIAPYGGTGNPDPADEAKTVAIFNSTVADEVTCASSKDAGCAKRHTEVCSLQTHVAQLQARELDCSVNGQHPAGTPLKAADSAYYAKRAAVWAKVLADLEQHADTVKDGSYTVPPTVLAQFNGLPEPIQKPATNGNAPPPAKLAVPSIAPAPADGATTLTIVTAPASTSDTIAIYTPVAPASTPAATPDVTTVTTTNSATTVTTATTSTTPVPPPVCNANTTPVDLAAGASNLVVAGDQTTVLLKAPVAQGQVLCVVITSSADSNKTYASAQVTVAAPAEAALPPGFDWGLVRAYFTLGALTSQERDQFSHEDLFLAFRLDKSYLPLKLKNPSKGSKPTDPYQYSHWRPGINTFFETRLTSLPVAVQSCTPSDAGVTPVVTCSNAATSAGSASAGSAPAATATTTTAQAFLNSQKSARLEFGLYAPFLLHQWKVTSKSESKTGTKVKSEHYALFLAPLIKTGFDTALNGLNQTQQSSSTPTTVSPIGNSSEFYKFYDFGFRTGHYGLSKKADVAPDTISFIDVTFGRFSNMASLLCDTTLYNYSPGTNTCTQKTVTTTNPTPPSPAGVLPWQRDLRLHVEGLLQVPGTHGFSVGFSTNVAFDPLGHQGTGTIKHIRPNDDLRFLFAYKFDITTIAAKLAPAFSSN